MCSHSVKKHTFLTIQIGPMLAILNYYDQVSLERSQASGWLWDNDYPQLYQVKMEAQSAAAVKMLIFCQCWFYSFHPATPFIWIFFSKYTPTMLISQLARRTAAMTGLEVARPGHLRAQHGGEVWPEDNQHYLIIIAIILIIVMLIIMNVIIIWS